jgi:ribonuclease D
MGNASSHRRKHRQQSHTQSHAEGTITPVLQGHPLVPTQEAAWISSNADFLTLCTTLRESKKFAYDTEFIGEESYYAKTCLIQVATTEMVALIDPFEVNDLTPLHELIADQDVLTIVHSGSQDLEPVARLLGKPSASIFDTQIAAGLVGFPWPISLTKIIETILKHDVGGHFTFSQWDARPLTERQLVYAADDVRYLLAVHDHLETRLEELGRLAWATEEFTSLTAMESFQFDIKSTVKRICRTKNPRKKELQRIQAIATLREKLAVEHNMPTRTILPNECVIALARKPVDSIEKLASMKGFPKSTANKYGKQILKAMDESDRLEPISLRKPNAVERESETRQELDGVWALFGAWCVGIELSAGLVTNRPTFTDWFLALRDGKQDVDSPLNEGWRSEAVIQFARMIHSDEEITFSFDRTLRARSSS